ncbi:MAG: CRISPR system precrRNA processing endoribonuclease RAMP protein Cas6 [Sphaerotilus natans subsp. sulfidivorans]|uniref:CRISPR system precrRNA processing endoribonuclease RAMP protein Cas6 n=1 Tax=Sphaerotilus sulfidivorans TaxID=639200 RepID=UPI002352CFFC|nr:CRISPR system precrRNA processing endoribonuclease RAMP protein Cas6 [Sphaerotilus sulfidivorans]MCK6401070.1 CRISPR system precrRNA processing endoribonuclease RAMP protein Cas6 [Sphaerotilus sulfidivorans]
MSLRILLGPRCGAPVAWGGVLHGFVERAVMSHAPELLPLMRPAGRQALAHFAILPPPVDAVDTSAPQPAEGDDERLDFGILLFGAALAAQADTLAEALRRQCAHRLHGRPARLDAVRMIDAPQHLPALAVEPARAIRLHRLELRSPLLLASGSATHAGWHQHGHLPWPPLGSVLESIAARLRALAPAQAARLGLEALPPGQPRWRAEPAQWAIEPLTPAVRPARQIIQSYRTREHHLTPAGLIGTLIYPSHRPEHEAALLYWGQWVGVGQKTTMGFGSYAWIPS